jgi:hypothetical protein
VGEFLFFSGLIQGEYNYNLLGATSVVIGGAYSFGYLTE